MAFTQSCFIRKNTPELRKKLEELGYRYYSAFNKNAYYLWLGEGVIYDTFNINITTIEVGEYFSPYGISCGTNEELFLALAALRDDTDKNQWFLNGKGDWYLCLDNKFNEEVADWVLCTSAENWYKATVEEIIKHFTMKKDYEQTKI